MWQAFQRCREEYNLRYRQGIIRVGHDDEKPLWFGTRMHNVWEAYYLARQQHGGDDLALLGEHIASALSEHFPADHPHPDAAHFRAVAIAAWRAYFRRFVMDTSHHLADAKFEVEAVEEQFGPLPIINPRTGRPSRSFAFEGKRDLRLRRIDTGRLWLSEHKTTSRFDATYVDRLWADDQTRAYCSALQRETGEVVEGIVYTVTSRPGFKQREGETPAEFEERKKGMKQPGRAKWKMPETDEAFLARCESWYADQADRVERLELRFSPDELADISEQQFELSQQLLDAERRDRWSRNTASCFKFNRPCQYLPICRNGGKIDDMVEGLYEHRDPFEELDTDDAVADATNADAV